MDIRAGPCRAVLVLLGLLVGLVPPGLSWDADLELLDLVEEIPQSFYQFLSVDQDASSAEIKKAYRRLSLSLHPDKNKDEDAENQFRQLVAIYEVLKDDERRRSYDDILVNGLPDWRQPVFYYRRVRKMSNAELGFLLFLILTVGHYAVIWSIYLEKQLDELLSKKKKEKKKKMSSKPAEDLRDQDRPHWQDILPLKLSIWLYLSLKNLPQTVQVCYLSVYLSFENLPQTVQVCYLSVYLSFENLPQTVQVCYLSVYLSLKNLPKTVQVCYLSLENLPQTVQVCYLSLENLPQTVQVCYLSVYLSFENLPQTVQVCYLSVYLSFENLPQTVQVCYLSVYLSLKNLPQTVQVCYLSLENLPQTVQVCYLSLENLPQTVQ
ncbi:dnaJ homolog subfamily C member 1-like, partial [Tautogolabrus adspersus]